MIYFGKFLSQIRQGTSGNALVETALYLPIALILVSGVVDFSFAVSQKLKAQQAVARTLELTSNVGFSGLNVQMLKSEAAKAANVSEDRVTAKIWLECEGVEQARTVTQCTTSDGQARYASITIQDNYDLKFYSSFVYNAPDSAVYRVHGSLRIQ